MIQCSSLQSKEALIVEAEFHSMIQLVNRCCKSGKEMRKHQIVGTSESRSLVALSFLPQHQLVGVLRDFACTIHSPVIRAPVKCSSGRDRSKVQSLQPVTSHSSLTPNACLGWSVADCSKTNSTSSSPIRLATFSECGSTLDYLPLFNRAFREMRKDSCMSRPSIDQTRLRRKLRWACRRLPRCDVKVFQALDRGCDIVFERRHSYPLVPFVLRSS